MLELIDRLGPNNVHLSIFENNSTDATPQLLHDFKKQLKCNHTIVTTKISLNHQFTELYIENDPHTYVSRIAYLASIRNHALEPLRQYRSDMSINESRHFDKLLFLNDVIFSSTDVFRLLHTNNGDYAAACALDFINPVKFYDTLATRDADGYSMGFILYPFFAPGTSQSQLLRGDNLVQVKSCWSGMVAFDSAPFENGLRFRALNQQSAWDASECCLIHADINQPKRTFINSAVRVAYSDTVYIWQKRFAYFETLWIPIQRFITFIAGLPRYNAHRTSNRSDGFCWTRGKMVFNEHGWRRSDNINLFKI
jgi:hypothetical protein